MNKQKIMSVLAILAMSSSLVEVVITGLLLDRPSESVAWFSSFCWSFAYYVHNKK